MNQAEFLKKLSNLPGSSAGLEELHIEYLDEPIRGVGKTAPFDYSDLLDRILDDCKRYPAPATFRKIVREMKSATWYKKQKDEPDESYRCEICNGKRGRVYNRMEETGSPMEFYERCEACNETGRQAHKPAVPLQMITDESFDKGMRELRLSMGLSPDCEIDERSGQTGLNKIGV